MNPMQNKSYPTYLDTQHTMPIADPTTQITQLLRFLPTDTIPYYYPSTTRTSAKTSAPGDFMFHLGFQKRKHGFLASDAQIASKV